MKKLSLLLAFLLLAGCSSTPKKSYIHFWQKAGVDYETAVTIEAECLHDAVSKVVASGQDLNLSATETKLVDSCMKAQGFRWGQYEQE